MTVAHGTGRLHRAVVSVVLALCASFVFASAPPSSLIHPQTGSIETVDAALHNGLYAVRLTITDTVLNQQTAAFLSAPSVDDSSPHIAASSAGDLWIAWQRNTATPQVVVVKQTYPATAWSSEVVVSESGESSSSPRLAHDGATVWIAYEIAASGGTSVAVVGPQPVPDPWPTRTIVGDTSYTGDRDLTLSAQSGHLWITWVHSATLVAWVEYDYNSATWTDPTYESYASDDVAAARQRIRAALLVEN